MAQKTTPKPKKAAERSVLSMTARQARAFFSKPESYCRLELPPYFDFGRVIRPVNAVLTRTPFGSLELKPRDHEGVNYTIYSNKDGRYAWRPFQIIHPALYIEILQRITEPAAWRTILDRFNTFQSDPKIKCLSLPVESGSKRRDQGAQVLHWWQGIEQASLELALDYNHVFHADITDCYAAVYTHSIAWAVHGRGVAKANRRDMSMIGNVIDARIQDMRNGQTNGIPQGSVLLDLVAEVVLGYADLELSTRLAEAKIDGYQVLRYRDDYRIFVNNPQEGELILKTLAEVLIDLGLKLNASKTTSAQAVVAASVKADKRQWMRSRQGDQNLQKHLLIIHSHGVDYPNAGSLVVALDEFYTRIMSAKSVPNPLQLISIAVDIGYHSPRCFPMCAAIVSKVLSLLASKNDKLKALARISKKLGQLPNNGHLEVWLQRLSVHFDPTIAFTEKLCRLVRRDKIDLWDDSWITHAPLRAAVDCSKIVNRSKLKAVKPIVPRAEFSPFAY